VLTHSKFCCSAHRNLGPSAVVQFVSAGGGGRRRKKEEKKGKKLRVLRRLQDERSAPEVGTNWWRPAERGRGDSGAAQKRRWTTIGLFFFFVPPMKGLEYMDLHRMGCAAKLASRA